MASPIQKYLKFSATQAGADAFKETAIDTNLVASDGFAFQIKRVVFAFTEASTLASISADSSIVWGLTRDTKLAVADYSDDDVFFKAGFNNALTTSGEVIIPYQWEWIAPDGAIIVESQVYFQIDSGATGLTMTVHGRIYYEEVKLSEVEILRLLNNA